MKRLTFIIIGIVVLFSGCSKAENDELKNVDDVCSVMDDSAFRTYCLENFDFDKDGKLSMEEAEKVTRIDINYKGIRSLTGIAYFKNLEILNKKAANRGTMQTRHTNFL